MDSLSPLASSCQHAEFDSAENLTRQRVNGTSEAHQSHESRTRRGHERPCFCVTGTTTGTPFSSTSRCDHLGHPSLTCWTSPSPTAKSTENTEEGPRRNQGASPVQDIQQQFSKKKKMLSNPQQSPKESANDLAWGECRSLQLEGHVVLFCDELRCCYLTSTTVVAMFPRCENPQVGKNVRRPYDQTTGTWSFGEVETLSP